MKTKRSFLLGVLFFIFSTATMAQDSYLVDYDNGTLEDISSMATNDGKYIIIEFSEPKDASTIAMEKKLFNDEKIAGFIKERFILYRYNPKSDKRGSFRKQFDISIYPTFLFLNGEMKELYRLAGETSKDVFLQALSYASSPDNNMLIWQQQIKENGAPNSEAYFNYAKGLLLGGQDYDVAADNYFKHSSADFTKEGHGTEAVLLFTENMNDPRFIILMENYHSISHDGIDDKYFLNRVNEIVSNSLVASMAEDNKISLEDTILKTAEALNIEDPTSLSALVKMKYYSTVKNNEDEYFRAMVDYLMSAMFLLDDTQVHNYLKEIAKSCNDQDIRILAMNRLFDLIASDNKTEYQKTLIEFSIKNHDFVEANHALEVLTKLNADSKTFSASELDDIRNLIVDSQSKYKEEKKSKNGKKKR